MTWSELVVKFVHVIKAFLSLLHVVIVRYTAVSAAKTARPVEAFTNL